MANQFLAVLVGATIAVVIDEVERSDRKRKIQLAIEVIEDEALQRPGRGYMRGGDTPRARNLPPFNRHLVTSCLADPVKCMANIIYYLYPT